MKFLESEIRKNQEVVIFKEIILENFLELKINGVFRLKKLFLGKMGYIIFINYFIENN